MYLLTRKNKIIDYCKHGYTNVGNMVVCESKGCTFDEATIVYTEKDLPIDIDSIPYDYINGEFIKSPDTTYGFVLKDIKITTPPEKLEYWTGERFDSTGMKVTAIYTNGLSFETTNYIISPNRELTPDITSVTVTTSEGGVTATTSLDIKVYSIYGVSIDLSNSNPDTSVTYTDDAVGMSPGSNEWDNTSIFKNIRPCVISVNASNQYTLEYLDPENFTLKEDGSSISLAANRNVMIRFPKLGVKINTEGNILTVQITDCPNATDEGYHYYAHSVNSEGDRNSIYIGAYLSSATANLAYPYCSHPACTPATGVSNIREKLPRGYELISFYAMTLLQCLYLLRYKNLDAQRALGLGYSIPLASSSPANTGGTASKGMYYGDTTNHYKQVKFAGIEDFYGNIAYRIDGVYISSIGALWTAFSGFNDEGSDYPFQEYNPIQEKFGYMSKSIGSTVAGFLPIEVEGSSTTYFADYVNIKYNSNLAVGNNEVGAGYFKGPFSFSKYEETNELQGFRLMYRG